MVDEGRKSNGCDRVVLGSKRETGNGSVGGVDDSGGCSLQFYKRRRCSKTSYTSSSETKYIDRKASVNSVNPLSDKIMKELVDLGPKNSSCNGDESITRTDSLDCVNGCGEFSPEHWRKIALQQMHCSLSGNEDGLKGCIRDALEIQTQTLSTTSVREPALIAEGLNKCSSNPHSISNHSMSNGSAIESNGHTNTELCKRAFVNILTSDKFRDLCHLILDNFNGVRVDSLFDVRAIDLRMKEGAYDNSPFNFHSDLQLVWRKLELIGTKMVAFSKNVSEQSRSSCEKELSTQEKNTDLKREEADTCAVYKLCTCRHCGQKAIWKDCLVCDSCEEMYHISCTKIPKHQIPPATWYCTLCINSGAISLHDNCTLCEKLDPLKTKTPTEKPSQTLTEKPTQTLNENPTQTPTENPTQTVDASPALPEKPTQTLDEDPVVPEKPTQSPKEEDTQDFIDISKQCFVCGTDVKDADDFRICTHDNCPHSHYHIRCLSKRQLNSYTSRWYCPSCLCSACLTDRDDSKILLCDSCDDAYHIYCLDPPLREIPEGKWFCRKCDAGIKRLREANMVYSKKEIKVESNVHKLNPVEIKMKRPRGRPSKKNVGVDMLLTAAKTLEDEKVEVGNVNL